jgi:hypothetical protein
MLRGFKGNEVGYLEVLVLAQSSWRGRTAYDMDVSG